MSLNEPVYNDGGDALYVMDQISDKKNKEENWIEELALQAAMEHLGERENILSDYVFLRGAPRWKLRKILIFPRHR